MVQLPNSPLRLSLCLLPAVLRAPSKES